MNTFHHPALSNPIPALERHLVRRCLPLVGAALILFFFIGGLPPTIWRVLLHTLLLVQQRGQDAVSWPYLALLIGQSLCVAVALGIWGWVAQRDIRLLIALLRLVHDTAAVSEIKEATVPDVASGSPPQAGQEFFPASPWQSAPIPDSLDGISFPASQQSVPPTPSSPSARFGPGIYASSQPLRQQAAPPAVEPPMTNEDEESNPFENPDEWLIASSVPMRNAPAPQANPRASSPAPPPQHVEQGTRGGEAPTHSQQGTGARPKEGSYTSVLHELGVLQPFQLSPQKQPLKDLEEPESQKQPQATGLAPLSTFLYEEKADANEDFIFGNPFEGPLPDVFLHDDDLKRSIMEQLPARRNSQTG